MLPMLWFELNLTASIREKLIFIPGEIRQMVNVLSTVCCRIYENSFQKDVGKIVLLASTVVLQKQLLPIYCCLTKLLDIL